MIELGENEPDSSVHVEGFNTSDAEQGARMEGSSISRNLAHLFSAQLITGILAILLSIVQPRLLGPTAQGQLRLGFSIWTIAQVFVSLGTANFLTLEVARNQRRGLAELGPILVLRTIVFLVASIVIFAIVALSDFDRRFIEIMVLYGVMVLLASWTEAIASAFNGLERMSVPARANVVARVFGTVVAITVLFAGGDARTVVAIAAVANLVGLAIVTRAIRRLTTISFRRWWVNAPTIAHRSIGFLFAAAIIVIYQQIDTIVISLFVDTRTLGWYATADALFGSLLFVTTIVMSSIFPVLGRLFKADPAALRALIRRTVSALMLVAVPLGLGTTVISGQLAPLLYGDDFREVGPVLAVLGPVITLTFGTILFGTIALATERQGLWNTVMVVAVVLTVPLDMLFVPWTDEMFSNGAIGGAMAYIVTEGLMIAVGLWKIAPSLVDRAMASRFARVLLAGGVMFAASWPLRDRFIAAPVVVAVIVYGVAVLVLRVVTEDERAIAGRALARVGLRTGSRLSRNGS